MPKASMAKVWLSGVACLAIAAVGAHAESAATPVTSQAETQGASYACTNVTNSGFDYRGTGTAGNSYKGASLVNANFSGTDLTGTDFTDADLTGADLSGATLGTGGDALATTFAGAILKNTCLDGIIINGTPADPGADFQFAQFDCAAITSTDITNAIFGLTQDFVAPTETCRNSFNDTVMTCEFLANWKDLDLSFADVTVCKDQMAGLDLSGTVMQSVQLQFYDLTGTDFSGASLRGINLYAATLTSTDFSGALMQYAALSSVSAEQANFSTNAQLSGATLSYGNFQAANFQNAFFQQTEDVGDLPMIPGAVLSFGNFHEADFTDAAMVGINLSGASLYDHTIMASASIENTNMSNAELSALDLKSAGLAGITFDYSNMINADLTGANLAATGTYRAASLAKANLQGVRMAETQLGGVNMANAAVALSEGVPLFDITGDVAGLESDLRAGWLTSELYAAFEGNGYALSYCSSPDMTTLETGTVWLMQLHLGIGSRPTYVNYVIEATDTPGLQVFGVSATGSDPLFTLDGSFADDLDAQAMPRALYQAFSDYLSGAGERTSYLVCTGPSAFYSAVHDDWEISTNLSAVTSPVVGYTGFTLVQQDNGSLQAYGTEVTTVFQNADGRLVYTSNSVQETTFDTDYFSDTTVTPNGNTYGANVQAGLTIEEMMTAPSPPPPPSCSPGSPLC
mmetsp:Transcript_7126/g.11662  ORF Transcript_7126/g.11662 Transcript_7126/m.11662 type:complete len:687 (-) Transcript_7126:13-2073(-)